MSISDVCKEHIEYFLTTETNADWIWSITKRESKQPYACQPEGRIWAARHSYWFAKSLESHKYKRIKKTKIDANYKQPKFDFYGPSSVEIMPPQIEVSGYVREFRLTKDSIEVFLFYTDKTDTQIVGIVFGYCMM